MRLKDAVIGKEYTILDIQLCDGCDIVEGGCTVLSLMDKGLIPGESLKVVSKKLGMYELMIGSTHLIIRKPEIEKFNIKVE